MIDDTKPPLPETIAMRDLSEPVRNKLIVEGNNVVDLRPTLDHNKKQRQLAKQYRKPPKPSGNGPRTA